MFGSVFFPSDPAVARLVVFNASVCISGCSSVEGRLSARDGFSKTWMELCYCQVWMNANVQVRGGEMAIWRVLLSSSLVVPKGFCCGYSAHIVGT